MPSVWQTEVSPKDYEKFHTALSYINKFISRQLLEYSFKENSFRLKLEKIYMLWIVWKWMDCFWQGEPKSDSSDPAIGVV